MRNTFVQSLFGFAMISILLSYCAKACHAEELSQEKKVDLLLDELEGELNVNRPNSKAIAILWNELNSDNVDLILPILERIDRADSRVTVNWLVAGLDSVFQQILKSTTDRERLVAPLKKVLHDRNRSGYTHRAALDCLEQVVPDYREKVYAQSLGDPVFGHQAALFSMERADAAKEAGNNDKALSLYREALQGSTDYELCVQLAEKIQQEGEAVDLAEQLGILRHWTVLGPFPGHQNAAFENAYPPEQSVFFGESVTYRDKEYRWQPLPWSEESMTCDFKEVFGPIDDAVAFACTEVVAENEKIVRLCVGADDNVAIWCNGKKVFEFPHYNNHLRPDRHQVDCKLKKGVNRLLLKVAEVKSDPKSRGGAPPRWRFVARLVDESGHGMIFPPSEKIRELAKTENEQ